MDSDWHSANIWTAFSSGFGQHRDLLGLAFDGALAIGEHWKHFLSDFQRIWASFGEHWTAFGRVLASISLRFGPHSPRSWPSIRLAFPTDAQDLASIRRAFGQHFPGFGSHLAGIGLVLDSIMARLWTTDGQH